MIYIFIYIYKCRRMGISKYVSRLRYSFWRKTHQWNQDLPRPKDLNLDWPAPGFMHPNHGFSRTPGTKNRGRRGRFRFRFRFRQLSYPKHVEFISKNGGFLWDFTNGHGDFMPLALLNSRGRWRLDMSWHVPFVDDEYFWIFLNLLNT